LGQLVAPLRDLAPAPGSGAMVRSSPSQLQARAEQKYAYARRNALVGFLIPNLVCWVIWLATGFGMGFYFPWPIFVTVGTGIRLVQVTLNKQMMIESIKNKEQRREQRRIDERPR
ncbi:MAG: hypothetical protein M3Y66_03835, partial [Actinomycetota bacterium]|nr:hypothetical protein [Actinomycetota bacterium]